MSERLSVLYHEKSICAFELVDAEGRYIEAVRHDVREASQAGTIGYVYLDGKTRNFKELWEKNQFFRNQNIRLFFFLNYEYKSNARNITSDEAECASLNGGEIFYLNLKDNTILFRKKYRDCNGETRYYEEAFDLDIVIPDVDGRITRLFLEHFQIYEKEEKLKFKKVKRIPAEEGVSEEFQSLDYLLMDSLEEIWILPRFLYRIEKDEEATDRRLFFLEEQNLIMLDMDVSLREGYAWKVADYISKHLNSWDWI